MKAKEDIFAEIRRLDSIMDQPMSIEPLVRCAARKRALLWVLGVSPRGIAQPEDAV